MATALRRLFAGKITFVIILCVLCRQLEAQDTVKVEKYDFGVNGKCHPHKTRQSIP